MDKEFAVDNDARLEELVESAEHGEAVVLTRAGRIVAKVVPSGHTPKLDRTEATKIKEEIQRLSEGQFLGGLSIKDLINEGRKY